MSSLIYIVSETFFKQKIIYWNIYQFSITETSTVYSQILCHVPCRRGESVYVGLIGHSIQYVQRHNLAGDAQAT